jgi:hypothetical protein
MKYMVLIYVDDALLADLPAGEADDMMRDCLTRADELRAQGFLLDSQMLEGPETATSLRVRNGRRVATDGPFSEAKEVLGGFNLIEAESMDEALRIASEFPWASIGCVEVRPVRDIDTVRRRVFPATACLAAAALLAGCQDGPTACDLAGRAGIVVQVTDAATGAPLSDGLHGAATSGDYRETLIASESGLVGLHERPGTYTIRIERDGYLPWDSAGIRVRQSGACHVGTSTLSVPLQPA